jgi:P27 family predicted phage terminase small subunit
LAKESEYEGRFTVTAKKPAAIKKLEGNPGKRPIQEEPEPRAGAPKPPADLSGEAFAEWCRIVPDLDAIGLLAKVDRGYLVAYCEAWASFNEARTEIAERGILIPGRDGGLVKNPAAQIMKDSMDAMLKFGAKFGLSPGDRARMGTAPKAEEPEGHEATVLSILS